MISALIEFLAIYYHQGNADGVAATAEAILAAIPDDIVALQFLALALLQLGRQERAAQLLRRIARLHDALSSEDTSTVCVPASRITYREATSPQFGLQGGWQRLALAFDRLGLGRSAERARRAARIAASGDVAVSPGDEA